MPDNCPTCGQQVVLATIENKRNGRWTILPLERVPDAGGDFRLTAEDHEAVDIMGEPKGDYPVAIYGEGDFRTHRPSHYLGDPH